MLWSSFIIVVCGNHTLSVRMPTSENPEQEWEDLEKQFNRLEVFYSVQELQKTSVNNEAYIRVQSRYTYVLQDVHKEYCRKVDDVKVIQKQVMESINHQRYCLKQLQDVLKRLANDKELCRNATVELIEMSVYLVFIIEVRRVHLRLKLSDCVKSISKLPKGKTTLEKWKMFCRTTTGR